MDVLIGDELDLPMVAKAAVQVDRHLIDSLFSGLEVPEICGNQLASTALLIELLITLVKARILTVDQVEGMVSNARSRIIENLEISASESDDPVSYFERVKVEALSKLDPITRIVREES